MTTPAGRVPPRYLSLSPPTIPRSPVRDSGGWRRTSGAGANGDDAGATDDDSDEGGGGGGGGSAIVYVHSQHEAEKVADLLVELGIRADFYHAQVEPAVRAAVHRRWLRGETQAW